MNGRRLRWVAAWVLVAAGSACLADDKDDAKALEGTWALVGGEQEGKPLAKEKLKGGQLVIKGDQHTVQVGEDRYVGRHKLDPSKSPKTIDATDVEGPFKGKTVLGIYEVTGKTFKVCFAPPGKDRPTAFTTKEGTGTILHVWERQKK